MLSPYLGYGYRNWDRGLRPPSPIDDFTEIYEWHYVPVGFVFHSELSKKWSVHPSFEGRFMFQGNMTVKYNDPNFNEPHVTLSNRPGFKLDFPIRYNFSRKWAIITTPWYSNSKIGQSNTADIYYNGMYAGFLYEPASETNQFGVNLTFSHLFD
jgi:hypothetical protein